MLKIRQPLGRLIFKMAIAIPGKTIFLIETAPWTTRNKMSLNYNNNQNYDIKALTLTQLETHVGQHCGCWCPGVGSTRPSASTILNQYPLYQNWITRNDQSQLMRKHWALQFILEEKVAEELKICFLVKNKLINHFQNYLLEWRGCWCPC